MTVLKFIEVD